MLETRLTADEKDYLEKRHKKERDKRVADRIKVILLKHKGWSQKLISEALLIREETVHQHIIEYKQNKSLKPRNGGSSSKLSRLQSMQLVDHLTTKT